MKNTAQTGKPDTKFDAELARRVGDCLGCAHAKTLKTKTGSAIFLCGRAEKESAYPRYPALPKSSCPGRTPA